MNSSNLNSHTWSSLPFNSRSYYDSLINKLALVDPKMSIFYLDLYHLYFESSKTTDFNELLSIQRRIDDIFISFSKDSSTDSNDFKHSIKFVLSILSDIYGVIESNFLDLDIDRVLLAKVIICELFKVFYNPDGIEELVVKSRIVKSLLIKNKVIKYKNSDYNSNNYERLEIQVHAIVNMILANIYLKTSWWDLHIIKKANKNVSIIKPTNEAFDKFKHDSFYISIDLPRLVKPILSIDSVVHYSHKNKGKTLITDKIFKILNKLSCTPFQINQDVYKWLLDNKSMWDEDLPTFESLTGLNNATAYKFIMQKGTTKKMYNNIMNTANLLIRANEFYFPCYMDWRGRIYAKGEYINYQSNKLALSLLVFKKGVVIQACGIVSLKLYGAGLYGIGVSNESKLSWVDKHHNDIIGMNPQFLVKAKNLPLFVAFCFEYKKCMSCEKPVDFISHLPILVDATCSGLQHLSSMIADINVGKSVNLVESHVIQDIYNNIAQVVNVNLQLDFQLDRNFVKKIIMCVPYNVGSFTAAQYFIEKFNYHPDLNMFSPPDKPDVLISYKDLYKLSNVVYKTFYKLHPKMSELVDYFKNIARLMSIFNCPIEWSTPSGLTITQCYLQFNNIKTKGLWDIRTIALKVPTKKIDIIKQTRSLMPNLIHSFDASNVIKAFNLFGLKGDRHLFTIHDCFATHAGHIEILQHSVKQAFVEMYVKRDFIDNFHMRCLNRLETYDPSLILVDYKNNIVVNKFTNKSYEIPIKPLMGDLEIKDIIKSKYMIH